MCWSEKLLRDSCATAMNIVIDIDRAAKNADDDIDNSFEIGDKARTSNGSGCCTCALLELMFTMQKVREIPSQQCTINVSQEAPR